MRLLDRFGCERHLAEMIILAVKGKGVLRKTALENLQPFFDVRGALRARDAQARKLAQPVPLSDAEIQTSIGNNVYGRGILCHTHGVMEGQDDDEGAEANTACARGNSGENREESR